MKNRVSTFTATKQGFIILVLALFSFSAFAGGYGKDYKVTITNVTKAQAFTPLLLATHKPGLHFFELGEMASQDIADIAEGGNIAPLMANLEANPMVKGLAATDGLLMAGESVEVMITAQGSARRLSLAAMLLPTNDTFVALDAVFLPTRGKRTVFARAYDAGSETNDELCVSIPGPLCGGAPFSPEDEGEGFVHVAAGIHGMGDVDAAIYDWRGPVAKIVIERM